MDGDMEVKDCWRWGEWGPGGSISTLMVIFYLIIRKKNR